MANITSIRTDSKPPNRIMPFLLGLVGVLLLIVGISEGGTAFLIGAVLSVVAVVTWKQAKPTYTIFFGTAGGERRALESEDSEYVERVARAIDKALMAGR